MTTDQMIALIVAVGGGAFVREIVVGLWRWLTGRQTRERSTIQRALRDLDRESPYRRRVEEHASEVRRIAVNHGLADELPPWPERRRTPIPRTITPPWTEHP